MKTRYISECIARVNQWARRVNEMEEKGIKSVEDVVRLNTYVQLLALQTSYLAILTLELSKECTEDD